MPTVYKHAIIVILLMLILQLNHQEQDPLRSHTHQGNTSSTWWCCKRSRARPRRRRRHQQRHQAPIHSSAWVVKIGGPEAKAQDIIKKSIVLWFFHRWTFKNVCWMFTSSSRKKSQLTKIFVKWVETTSASKSHVVEARVKYATSLQICPLPLTEGLLVSLRFFQGPRLWGREDCIEMGKCQKNKDLSPHRIKSTTFLTTLNKAPWG